MAKDEKIEVNVSDCGSTKKGHHHHDHGAAWGGFYCLGMIGVAVYYIQQVSGFWPTILAILKSFVWPAFLLYKVFTLLHM